MDKQAVGLWRSDSPVYAPGEFKNYKDAYSKALSHLNQEQEKMIWFRKYKSVAEEYRKVYQHGVSLLSISAQRKRIFADDLRGQLSELQDQVDNVKGLTNKLNEGRVARKDLMRAEFLIAEGRGDCENGKYFDAQRKIRQVNSYLHNSFSSLDKILNRYKDKHQLERWTRWVELTIAESRQRKTVALIVDKIHRRLLLYKNGQLQKTYDIGIGRNGLNDKIHSGDNATPEGRYRIAKKIPHSQYYKALLVDYPNQEDRKRFQLMKRQGLIPANAGIGGLIEIHGGGVSFMTKGCVALANHEMDEIYQISSVNTLVTIVGSIGYSEDIFSAYSEITHVSE